MTIGIMAGSFDPVTLGHIYVMEKALKMCDELIILIATNPDKKYNSSYDTRFSMIYEVIDEHFIADQFRIFIENLPSDMFTVARAQERGASLLFRGLRNVIDFEYEHGIQNINSAIAPEVTTVFIMPPPELVAVSSSAIRGMIGVKGAKKVAEQYVPQSVVRRLFQDDEL